MLDCGLYIVATPIGNLKDISARALEVLEMAEIIACEDTRVSKKLFNLLGLSLQKKFISYQDHNEGDKADMLAQQILNGASVALISDAGSPLISDPGYKLVRRCRELAVPVFAVPGASAVIAALQLCGLPTNRFMFAGFIPNKDKARTDLFHELKDINTTLVFYETAPRLVKTLQAAADCFANREIAVVREITKVYEECKNGRAADLAAYYIENPPKGEIVLLVEPPAEKTTADFDIQAALQELLKTMSVKSAVDEVVKLSGQNRRKVYQCALELSHAKQ